MPAAKIKFEEGPFAFGSLQLCVGRYFTQTSPSNTVAEQKAGLKLFPTTLRHYANTYGNARKMHLFNLVNVYLQIQ